MPDIRDGGPAVKVSCDRCQGNGEIVTDWERYRHPRDGDLGDEAVAECPDCNGEGEVAALRAQPAGVKEIVERTLDAAGTYMGEQYGNTALHHPTDRARIVAALSALEPADYSPAAETLISPAEVKAGDSSAALRQRIEELERALGDWIAVEDAERPSFTEYVERSAVALGNARAALGRKA